MPEFRLSCYALVRDRKGRVLVLRRPSEKRRFAGQWELPGGKAEAGETMEGAACREVEEEAGIRIAIRRFAGAVELPLAKVRVVLLIFEGVARTTTVTLSDEHQDGRWVELKEVRRMNITPTLRAFLRTYRGTGRR